MNNLEKILEIKVDVGEAIRGIDSLNAAISEQKKRQEELKKQIKQLEEAGDEYSESLAEAREEYILSQQKVKDYNSQIQGLSKTVQNQLKIDRENIGSMQQLRAQLSNLTKAYDSLSAEEREAAKGQELKDKINQVTDALKNSEEATQRYYRNVGNYENAIKNSLGLNSKFGQTLQNVAEVTRNGVGPALKETATATANVGKQMLKLLANPIVAILAAVAVAIMAVVKGIKSSEENTAKWSATMAKFKPFVDVVTVACQKFAGVILDIVGWIGKATGSIMKWLEKLPLVGDNIAAINAESERYIQLEKDKYELNKRSRDLEVESSKAARDVAELRTKAKDKEHYTDQQRLAFVQEANRIEGEIAAKKKAQAMENLRILQEEAQATQNQKQIEEELARAEAEVYRAETEYNTKIRELLEQENTIKNEIAAEDKARADEAKRQNDEKIKQQKEYNDTLVEEMEKTQDLLADLIKEGTEKEEELEKLRHERQMNYLGEKIEEYANDAKMLTEFLTQLQAEEQLHADTMARISEDARTREAEERALDWENRLMEAELFGGDYNDLVLEMLQQQIDTMYQMQGESDAEFYNRKLKAQKAYMDEKKRQDDAEVAMERAKTQAVASLAGNLSSALEAMAGDNKKRLKAAKVAAMAEVMLNQGLAIAQAVKAGGDYPFPYNLITIASSVAGALAAIAPAVTAVKSVKLARGGYVSGPGTSTSDSIPAMLSNGEFVVNAKATSMFPELLETINNLGLGIAAPARVERVYQTQKETMTMDMMVKAFKQLPRPVVGVEEVSRVEDRVDSLENLTRL